MKPVSRRKKRASTDIRSASVSAIAGLAFLAGSASAAMAVELRMGPDQTKVIALAGQPATVIVGNPVYADVTLLDHKIVIQGRMYGKTNIYILDSKGNKLANLDVVIASTGVNKVAVYKAGNRTTYTCAPKCEQDLNVGDAEAAFDNLSRQIFKKMAVAKYGLEINN